MHAGRSIVALQRVGWLVAIWSLSVVALGVFAFLFRLLMMAAGLTAGVAS